MPHCPADPWRRRRSAAAEARRLSDDVQKTVEPDALGIPVRDQIRTTAGGSAAPNTPAGVLDGVDVWVPDWNAVLAELDADVAAYQKATGN